MEKRNFVDFWNPIKIAIQFSTGLLLIMAALFGILIAETAVAGPSCGRNSDHPKCVKDDPGGRGKVYAVRVTFDDADNDSIKSDGDYYISDSGAYPDSGVGARLPVEFSPPGQFVMTLRLNGDRTLFFDFGEAVDCDTGDKSATGACVWDEGFSEEPVSCLFPLGERFDVDGNSYDAQCSGYKQVVMAFRHTVESDNNQYMNQYMLGMTPNEHTVPGEADNIEIGFREESRKDDDLRLRFRANCLGSEPGDFLNITAFDHLDDPDDLLPNDEWYIGTWGFTGEPPEWTGTKTACLTKKGNGKNEVLVGLFEMQFGYTICILADPDGVDPNVPDCACLGEADPPVCPEE